MSGPNNGYPILYFHGTPGSGKEILFFSEYGERYNLQFISFTRNEVRSDHKPHLPEVYQESLIQEILRQLAIQRISILAFSGGTSYALKQALSGHIEIDRLALVSPYLPYFKVPKSDAIHASVQNLKCLFRTMLFKHSPLFLWPSMKQAECTLKRSQSSIFTLIKGMSREDKEILTQDNNLETFQRCTFDAFRHGVFPILHDLRVIANHKYSLDLTSKVPVFVIYGLDDSSVSPSTIALLTAIFPLVKLYAIETRAHYLIASCQDILCHYFSKPTQS